MAAMESDFKEAGAVWRGRRSQPKIEIVKLSQFSESTPYFSQLCRIL